MVVESWASGLLPLVPEAIRIVPASTAAASKSSSSRGKSRHAFDALPERSSVTCCNDKPAITALIVQDGAGPIGRNDSWAACWPDG